VLDNYEMNTGTRHPFAAKRNESRLGTRSSSSVPLTLANNIMWSCEISIGTPPKTRRVTIDTGSADMWVLQTGCSGIPPDRDLWDPNLSQSAKKKDQRFELKYGDGIEVKGDGYTDNVTIAGLTADPQTFGSITVFGSQQLMNGFYTDGLLGLALPRTSDFRGNPPIVSLYLQDKITSLTFSLKLASPGPEMRIGGVNSMLYKGDIVYIPVTKPLSGIWRVSMDNIRVNGNPVLSKISAVMDTGSNYIYGNWDQVAELYGSIGGKLAIYKDHGFYYLRCDSFPTISVGFTFGGKTFEIPPDVFNNGPANPGSPYCRGVIVGKRSYPFWLIGHPFLKTVYSVFDYSGLVAQVGFAELA